MVILLDELPQERVVGLNAANFARSKKNIFKQFMLKETLYRCLVGKVKFTMDTGNDACEAYTQ